MLLGIAGDRQPYRFLCSPAGFRRLKGPARPLHGLFVWLSIPAPCPYGFGSHLLPASIVHMHIPDNLFAAPLKLGQRLCMRGEGPQQLDR